MKHLALPCATTPALAYSRTQFYDLYRLNGKSLEMEKTL